jgi:hypothetical protein
MTLSSMVRVNTRQGLGKPVDALQLVLFFMLFIFCMEL